MTGLERNADVVRLALPMLLFAHVDAWQWNPDLIWFDNLRMMRTPNYYITADVRYECRNRCAEPANGRKTRDEAGQPLCIGSAGCSYGRSNSKACRSTGSRSEKVQIEFSGLKKRQKLSCKGSCTYLQSDDWKPEYTGAGGCCSTYCVRWKLASRSRPGAGPVRSESIVCG